MNGELIHPNWHVILIHFPLALLATGVLIELVSLIRSTGDLRAAGRWMILLGSLLAVPAALSGVFAFRDAVTTGPIALHHAWYATVEESHWIPAEWEFMSRHVWLNSAGAIVALAVVIAWIALSPRWRRRLYAPLLVLLLASLGLFMAGAWHGGEAVYRYGTAVTTAGSNGPGGGPGPVAADLAENAQPAGEKAGEGEGAGDAGRGGWISPLQLHITVAGFGLAIAFGALALALRSWRRALHESEERAEAAYSTAASRDAPVASLRPVWLLAVLLLSGAAVAGVWSFNGSLAGGKLERNLELLGKPELRRVLLHVGFGLALVILPGIALAIPRLLGRNRIVAGIFSALLVVIAGGQIWFGTLLLFDSHEGPLFGFQSAPPPEARDLAAGDDEDIGKRGGTGGEAARAREEGTVQEATAAAGEARPREATATEAEEATGEPAAAASRTEASESRVALTVRMTADLAYEPANATVPAGATVEWTNPSSKVHTVTADPEIAIVRDHVRLPEGAETFDSGDIEPGKTYRRAFTVPGKYRYFCIPHESDGMIGELTVEPKTKDEPPGREGKSGG